MITAYLAFKTSGSGTFEADQILIVSNAAQKVEGSRMFLDPKVPVSVSSLIKGTIIQSINDAATTLVEAVGNGPTDELIKRMNEGAKRLGIEHIHLNSPTGIPSNGHVSTVGDLAILATVLINDYPKHYPLFADKSFKYSNIEQPNRSLLLCRDSSINGLRTGYSEGAGYHLAAFSKCNNRRTVSILADAESTEVRAGESSKLFNWSSQAFDIPKLYNGGEVVSQVKVYRGSTKVVDIGFLDDIYIIIPHDIGKSIKPILEMFRPVLAPTEKDQVLGKLKVMKGGKITAERDTIALNGVEEGNQLRRIWDAIALWFKGLSS